MINVVIVESGAYALFFEHGAEEIIPALTSASGVVIAAGAEEGEEEITGEHEGVYEEEEVDEEGGNREPATGKQWANALMASLVISLCRCFSVYMFTEYDLVKMYASLIVLKVWLA